MPKAATKTTAAFQRELVHALAEISPAMLWMGDQNGKCLFLSRALRDFWGVAPVVLSEFDWTSTIHPDDIQKLAGPFAYAMEKQISFEVEARYRRADGEYRTLLTQANPRFHPDSGKFLGMTGLNTDITERLAAEAATRAVTGELNHRTKNLMTIIQAIARQTAKHSASDEFHVIFSKRLAGLAASNDLLLRSDWSRVELHALVMTQLQHFEDFWENRLTVRGPAVTVSSKIAPTLGMAFHELATNSVKYGALSKPNGEVQIEWTLGDSARAVAIKWTETGIGAPPPPRGSQGVWQQCVS